VKLGAGKAGGTHDNLRIERIMNTRKILSVLVLPVFFTILTGCTSLSLKKPDVWPFNISDDKPGMPNQVVANWTDTMLYETNKTPIRGFGGRVLFYADGKKDPIKVEGSLVVYAFDEKIPAPNNDKPTRKFIFTKEQLASHYSKSKIGHSYSVWLPWDDAGGDQKEISLIARFIPEKGNVLIGEQTRHILPGKNTENPLNPNPAPFATNFAPIQQTSYQSVAAGTYPLPTGMESQNANAGRMITTTIPVPRTSMLISPPMMPLQGMQNASQNIQQNTLPNSQISAPLGGVPTNQAVPSGVNSPNPWTPASQPVPPPTRFGLGQSPVPGASFSPPATYRAPWQPSPAGPAFAPASTPSPAAYPALQASPQAGGSTWN
jgi:hypothetical protein